MLGEILHRKNEQIRQLQEEIDALKGKITAEQAEQDRADQEVIAIVQHRNTVSNECLHVVLA